MENVSGKTSRVPDVGFCFSGDRDALPHIFWGNISRSR